MASGALAPQGKGGDGDVLGRLGRPVKDPLDQISDRLGEAAVDHIETRQRRDGLQRDLHASPGNGAPRPPLPLLSGGLVLAFARQAPATDDGATVKQ